MIGYITLIIATIFALIYIGGYQGLFTALPAEIAPVYYSPLGSIPNQGFEWILGGVFGALAAQASIQPVFGAKNRKTARRASLITPLLVAPMGFLIATLGMISFVVNPGITNAKLALPILLMNADVVPPIVGALSIASIFGLVVGSTTSILLAVGSIISYDLYPAFTHKKNGNEG